MPVTILLAMRNEVFCKCFTDFIAIKTDATIVGSCNTALEVEPLYDRLRPDLLLMDIKLGSTYGFDMIKAILKKDNRAKIIGISSYYIQDIEERLQEVGAKGYMLRNDDIKRMENMIVKVSAGQTMFTQTLLPSEAYPKKNHVFPCF